MNRKDYFAMKTYIFYLLKINKHLIFDNLKYMFSPVLFDQIDRNNILWCPRICLSRPLDISYDYDTIEFLYSFDSLLSEDICHNIMRKSDYKFFKSRYITDG